MTAFVSLFRGINVGGRVVRMAELKALHEALGLKDTLTYIQSGNVIFTSDDTSPAQLEQQIEESFAAQFGFRSAVMVRSAAELDAIIEKSPFQGQSGKAPNWIVVMFLTSSPEDGALEALRSAYHGPEEIVLISKELYLYYPDGIGRSKLTNSLIEKRLKTAGTARNWNTVLQLQKMLQR
jgi:uncharacterized protein (DUF1697 family)